VTSDVAAATAAFREELVRYLSLPFYRAMLRASGNGQALAAFDAARGRTTPADAVPVALTGALGAIGDAGLVRGYVESYRAAGVTLPAVRPILSIEAPYARPTLAAVAPVR
jgi:hypothetical protein